jgi:predicted homoserine dehydrogenase-like protein
VRITRIGRLRSRCRHVELWTLSLRRTRLPAPLDVVATAKRDLAAGSVLDGEGGYTVWGKLLPAERSLALGALPIGLAHGVRLRRAMGEGEAIAWSDVEIDEGEEAVRLRREMERLFAPAAARAAE